MNRVPEKTYQEFVNFCHEEFADDFGMGLKHLWDFYKGIMPTGQEALEARLDALEQEVFALKGKSKSKSKGEEKKPIRTLSGRSLKRSSETLVTEGLNEKQIKVKS